MVCQPGILGRISRDGRDSTKNGEFGGVVAAGSRTDSALHGKLADSGQLARDCQDEGGVVDKVSPPQTPGLQTQAEQPFQADVPEPSGSL